MSVESFIQALPKVELHIHLEGAVQRDTLLMIAEQNEINTTVKNFRQIVSDLENPDYQHLDQLAREVSAWLQEPQDLARVVYDLGVMLSKQNIRYAEVSVNPALYMHNNLSFEAFLEAINDGRERAEKGWGARMSWVLTIPRDEPRRADDVLRWASSANGRKGGIVAMGLTGREDAQPVGQFERAFRNAEKKFLPRVPHAGDELGVEGILEVLQLLAPDRLFDGWGAAEAPDVLRILAEKEIPLDVSMARALCMGWVQSYADYPLRRLYDEGVKLTVGSDMPTFFKTNLVGEYLAVVEHCGFSVDELEELALNAVRYSLLPADEKQALLKTFEQEYAELRVAHIVEQAT
jgi:adenosine deaminase